MKLKEVPYTEMYKLPGENGTRRTLRDAKIINGTKHLFCVPCNLNEIWSSRGIWVDWETEVEVMELKTPYEKVLMEGMLVDHK